MRKHLRMAARFLLGFVAAAGLGLIIFGGALLILSALLAP